MASLQENEGYDFNEATAKIHHEPKAICFTVERLDNLSMSDCMNQESIAIQK